jgi:hypothetical protein
MCRSQRELCCNCVVVVSTIVINEPEEYLFWVSDIHSRKVRFYDILTLGHFVICVDPSVNCVVIVL